MQDKKCHEKKYQACLITGASSGLGRELSILLAKRANLLLLLGQNTIELQHTVDECKKLNPSLQVLFFAGDLCDGVFFNSILELFKTHPIDLVVNNAGAGLYRKTLEFPIDHLKKLFQLNGWVPLHLSYHALQHWQKENKPGTILQIGSALALIPAPYSALYGAAKSFIVQWSLALSEELRNEPQKILVFCPGMIKTPFAQKASLGIHSDLEGLEIPVAASLAMQQLDSGELLKVVPLKDRLLLFLAHFMPLKFVLKLIRKRIEIRI